MNATSHFTWRELLWLPSWSIEHIPSDVENTNLLQLANKMEQIREFLGLPINVHCAIRPILNNPSSKENGQDYNKFIGGAPGSAHKVGLAMDFDCGENCEDTRQKLIPKLEEFNVRMENNGPEATWVHIDLMDPHPSRYFKP